MRALLAVLLLAASTAGAEEQRKLELRDVPLRIERGGMERRDERAGSFELEVESLEPSGDRTLATVAIRNVSEHDLEEVELFCTAFDAADGELATTAWRLSEAGAGTMARGESMTVKLGFAARSEKVRSASCNARGW